MTKPRILAALTAVAILAGGTGTALAQGEGDTTVTVGPRVVLAAGESSPIDAPGVRAIRKGRDIPGGYRLIGREVSGVSGGVGAAIRFTCPDGKRLKTFGTTGGAGFQTTRDYVNHRSTIITAIGGSTGEGSVYAVCR
jgi:hypothetical protein